MNQTKRELHVACHRNHKIYNMATKKYRITNPKELEGATPDRKIFPFSLSVCSET